MWNHIFLFGKNILYTKEVCDKNKRIIDNSSKPKTSYAKVVKDKNKSVVDNWSKSETLYHNL